MGFYPDSPGAVKRTGVRQEKLHNSVRRSGLKHWTDGPSKMRFPPDDPTEWIVLVENAKVNMVFSIPLVSTRVTYPLTCLDDAECYALTLAVVDFRVKNPLIADATIEKSVTNVTAPASLDGASIGPRWTVGSRSATLRALDSKVSEWSVGTDHSI